jgi:hypothetical protein
VLPDDPWSLLNFEDWSDSQIAAYKQARPFETVPVAAQDAKDAYQAVLKSGGASLPKRDAVDQRIVEDVKNKTGRIINSQSQVGGWPELKSEPAPRDSDSDGMPDEWEKKQGLNPDDPADGAADADNDGYTNLEEYLNGLAAGIYPGS